MIGGDQATRGPEQQASSQQPVTKKMKRYFSCKKISTEVDQLKKKNREVGTRERIGCRELAMVERSCCASLKSIGGLMAPLGSMILAEVITASYIVMSKVILVQGISSTVFLFYQFILATVFISTLAFIFERKKMPPLTKQILGGIFLLALVGTTFAQTMLATALYFISSTIESSVMNMIPAITFILSLLTRQEKLQIHTSWGKGKIFGTLLSVSGALTLMFWTHNHVTPNDLSTNSTAYSTTIGLVMVVLGVVAFSTWMLMLEPMTKKFPAELSMTAIMLFFGTLQIGLLAVIINRKASLWQLNWDLELLNIFVGGALNNGLVNFFCAWCAGLKGPVFVASFSPLGLFFTTIFEMLFFGQTMSIGSVVGSIMIIIGLYVYLWSKTKEEAYQNELHMLGVGDEQTISSSLLSQNQC